MGHMINEPMTTFLILVQIKSMSTSFFILVQVNPILSFWFSYKLDLCLPFWLLYKPNPYDFTFFPIHVSIFQFRAGRAYFMFLNLVQNKPRLTFFDYFENQTYASLLLFKNTT